MDSISTRYTGILNSDVRIQLTDLIKVAALANMGKRPDVKKICGIVIEMLDNAQRYCADGHIQFTWSVAEGELTISIENKAINEDAHRLMHHVAAVNSMTQEEIRNAFRAQLTTSGFGEKGGAGLGLLAIARRSKSGIQAEIHPATDPFYHCKSQVSFKLH